MTSNALPALRSTRTQTQALSILRCFVSLVFSGALNCFGCVDTDLFGCACACAWVCLHLIARLLYHPRDNLYNFWSCDEIFLAHYVGDFLFLFFCLCWHEDRHSFGTKNVVIPQLFHYFEGKIVHIVILSLLLLLLNGAHLISSFPSRIL